jgi:hypothetical protein
MARGNRAVAGRLFHRKVARYRRRRPLRHARGRDARLPRLAHARQHGPALHEDNQTIIKERIYADKTNKNILHGEITLIDNAFTRPWTVTKDYRRAPQARPVWREAKCVEDNQHALIGKEHYMLSWDDLLMPAKKGQPAPDLRYFDKPG